MKELGVITLKGYMTDYRPEIEDSHSKVKYITFICPNPDCIKHAPDAKHIAHLPIVTGDDTKISHDRNSAVWHYDIIDDKHISVSPSILVKEDFHCGIPTYFELVNSREEL